jgi:phage/conjugal plasmid C-4 type zinc finger TraR family protein
MANELLEIQRVRTADSPRSRLRAELDDIAARLHIEAGVPRADVVGGDFLDIAQGIEHQELARLTASRLAERARRLRHALTRVSDGEYGICSECGTAIPPARLLAVPDAATCVACQSRLERVRAGRSGPEADATGV